MPKYQTLDACCHLTFIINNGPRPGQARSLSMTSLKISKSPSGNWDRQCYQGGTFQVPPQSSLQWWSSLHVSMLGRGWPDAWSSPRHHANRVSWWQGPLRWLHSRSRAWQATASSGWHGISFPWLNKSGWWTHRMKLVTEIISIDKDLTQKNALGLMWWWETYS